MNFRSLLPLLLLATQSALPGRDASARMRLGEDALAAGLWEMAALHFDECLTDPSLKPQDDSRVAIRLAEAWLRDGKAAEAFSLLGESFVSAHPELPFWKGQALVGQGRFGEAADVLAPLLDDPSAPWQTEAAFTLKNLQMALGKPDAALETLHTLALGADASLAAKARLHQVEILLDLGRIAEARKTMTTATAIDAGDRALATLLEAHLLLAEGRPADAAAVFQTLVDQPQGQSLDRHHLAAVGLADAFIAQENTEAATEFLLTFIQGNPDSPQLDALFHRLRNAMPATPLATDPILERLADWVTPPELPGTGLIAVRDSSAVAAWPALTTTSELLAQSLFSLSLGLQRTGAPEAPAEARRLFNRLRMEFPDHSLADRALFEIARKALADGAQERAFGVLASLRENAQSPDLRGQSAFLEAEVAFSSGDKELAALLFEEAAQALSENEAKSALFNAAILQLSDTQDPSTPVLQIDAPENRSLAADLMLERALFQEDPVAKRSAIEEFLIQHPDHPRVPEARIAAAEAALAGPAPDLSFARAQVETLAADPVKSAALSPSRFAMLRLRIADSSKDSAAAITTAREILDQYPADPAAAEAALILGRNLFQSRSYNDARLVLEKLAATDTDPTRAEAAWLLAARAAALVPTSQSQQEALVLFEKVGELKGPLAAIAMLEKSRLMIDMNRLAEAAAFLRGWFDSLEETDPLRLPAGLLLGEAIYGQGGTNPDSLTEALAVYDRLLADAADQPAVFNRLQYLRGRTLEQIPDESEPSRKRDKQAFIAYYSVLETTTPPAEWHYFELCGFRALALLENAGRWPAAIACARKIASFKGPRAEEAANRASQLQLKHMIWED